MMLERLQLTDFTVFQETDLQFSRGLNLFVGENGTGKTHLLKVGYTVLHSLTKREAKPSNNSGVSPSLPLEVQFLAKLSGVFVIDAPGDLVGKTRASQRATISPKLWGGNQVIFELLTSGLTYPIANEDELIVLDHLPVFLPTRELLTIEPFFVSLYDRYHLPFEETYRDTCMLLGLPPVRESADKTIAAMLRPLEDAIEGKWVRGNNGSFYLHNKLGIREVHVVAEGWRKLAMVAHLIATGQLTSGTALFWDEPEANLNPKLIKLVARTILHLCQNGVQVFLATHSLFLMRELDILTRNREFADVPARYFGLHPGDDGVTVQQGNTIDDMGEITSLQEELSQSDRYLDAERE